MRLIDSHTHLSSKEFSNDIDDVIQRMRAENVIWAVTLACSDDELAPLEKLLAEHSDILKGAWALHPEYENAREPDVDEIAETACRPNMVAVGETGLDFYWCKEPLDWQKERFVRHIEAARKCGKPLIIHARDSEREALDILKAHKAGDMGFVMHCYCGSLETALDAVNAGGHVSFTGNISFKRNDELRAVAAALPLERIMIETDSPYMAPVPFRGKRNESSYVGRVAEVVAQVKGISLEEAAEATTINALKFFSLEDKQHA